MPQLLRILAAFRAGRLDQAQLLAQLQALLAVPGVRADELIELLQAEHAQRPLPAAAFGAMVGQLRAATDRTLLRSPKETLAFLLGSSERTDIELESTHRSVNVQAPSMAMQAAAAAESFSRVLVNRFGLAELIGEGGMSRVYKAVDLRKVEAGAADPHVAVKVLNIPFDDVNDAMALLHRELSSLQILIHPNIVRVIDCDRDGDTVFMTMELLNGRTLNDRLKQPGFAGADRAASVPIVEGIARALEFAHGKRIVHGDLKPGNVVVTAAGEIKVIDFGIARAIADPIKAFMQRSASAADRVTGVTPAYASPQALEHREADPRDDVYALGCIAWEIMTGRHPFDRQEATLARERGLKPERSSRLSGREYRALAHALQFDRDDRTPSAAQFLEELTGVRARRTALLAAVGAAAVTAGAAIFAYWPHDKISTPPPLPAAEELAQPELSVGTVFRDCPTCPLMIVLPPGDFVQGVPANTPGTEPFEVPEHDVFIDYPFAASQHEVTVGEFAEFVEATRRPVEGCWKYDGAWTFDSDLSWESAVEGQTALHAVSCVSWDDAAAYAQWLSQRTGQQYRLPSAAEWEFAARGSSTAVRPWSSDTAACTNGNVADQTAARIYPGWTIHECTDTYVQTAPVGSFAANAFGLHDTLGNVFEWVGDCWHDDYVGAPADGSTRVDGDCSQHELRGGSWFTAPAFVRVSYRNRFAADYRSTSVGFRIVRKTAQ